MYRIKVQTGLIYFDEIFPHFPIARPLFYSVLSMSARLFGPALLFGELATISKSKKEYFPPLNTCRTPTSKKE